MIAQQVKNPTSIPEDAGSIPSLAQGLRIYSCHKLWYRSKVWLRYGVAVAVVIPGLGTFKKKKKKKKKPKDFFTSKDAVRGLKGKSQRGGKIFVTHMSSERFST